MSLLELDALRVTASTGRARATVLHDISLYLPQGGSMALVGESGAGKTLIARAIARALPRGMTVESGEVRLEGENLLALPAKAARTVIDRRVGFLPADPGAVLDPEISIGTQMARRLRRLGIARLGNGRTNALALLEAVEVEDAARVLRAVPHQVPAETRVRVLAALAFAARPRLLVADAPTAALDGPAQVRVLDMLARLQSRHDAAVLLLTRDLRLATRICDQVVVLYAGRAVESGPSMPVAASAAHPYTRCLQLAAPSAEASRRPLHLLPGTAPRTAELAGIAGCRFAARCPLAKPDCDTEEPPDVVVGPGRLAACAYAGQNPAIAVAFGRGDRASPPRGGATVLQIQGAGVRAASGPAFWRRPWLLRGASLSLREGEILGVIGPGAADRSVLPLLAAGRLRAAAGRVMLEGREGRPGARRRRVGLVTGADPALRRTARAWVGGRADHARVLLAEMGLTAAVARQRLGALSPGDRVRVAIARALARAPRLLVLDDPLAGLDPTAQAGILDLLLRLRAERGLAMIFASRDLPAVRHLCDRVMVVEGGAVVEEGPTDGVFPAPAHPCTRRLLAAVPPDDPHRPWEPLAMDRPAGPVPAAWQLPRPTALHPAPL